MHILYVEDNMANVALVRRVARGHTLTNYIDGQEALDNFDEDSPDLILMDIQLAGKLTGLEVVKELRKRGAAMPIIAVTAYAMVGDRERCLAAGCDEYMAKPLQVPELLTLFAKHNKPEPSETVVEDDETSSPSTVASSSTDADDSLEEAINTGEDVQS